MKIAITGIGTISAVGNNVAESLATLKSQKSPIKRVTGIRGMRKPYLGGQIGLSDEQLIDQLGLDKSKFYPRTALLALVAAKEAWGSSPIDPEIKTGLISATSVGGMELSEQFYKDYKADDDIKDIDVLRVHDNGAGTDILADELGIDSSIYTISTACSSAANAILTGARLILHGELDRVIVGGADALSNFTMNGFDSLMIYDTEWCKPFDNNRKGLNLGEGAGYVVLENDTSLMKTGNTVRAYLSGWGNANDAYHQTASSPDGKGATLAISDALETAGIIAGQIDYVNAHGTATPNNDLSESTAFMNIFGSAVPPFSSTKAFTGHTLAAAGGIEAVFSVMAIENNIMFPNLNFQNQMEEVQFTPLLECREANISHVLSNSFGFGGNTSSLIFSA